MSILQKTFLTLWALLLATVTPAQTLKSDISHWLSARELNNAGVAVSVVDLSDQSVIFETKPMLSLVPASIMKVITTAAALEKLGPDYRFKTVLSANGQIRNDTLFGDLQIVGGGDPTLGSQYFPETAGFQDEWISKLKAANIRVVTGNLVTDDGIYDRNVPGTWLWEDIGNYYGGGAFGLSVFDNEFAIHLQSPAQENQPVSLLKVVPEIPGLELRNEVLSSNSGGDQTNVFGNPEDARRVIRGTIPKGQNDFVVRASMPNPAAVLASGFMAKLSLAGIEVKGQALSGAANRQETVLAETLSPALREIVKVTNYESVNLFAETLLKHLGWLETGLGTTDAGCRFVKAFWKEKGILIDGFFMSDGSGLSRFDALTAQTMTAVLTYMKTTSAYADDFSASLPAAGEGTLLSFSKERFPGKSLRAKSGSMTRVRCYAGYLTTNSGKTLAFTVMLNQFSCSQSAATAKIAELLSLLRAGISR